MFYPVAFRYEDREYYGELTPGKELKFGSHKHDEVQIPDSADHMISLRILKEEVVAEIRSPLDPAKIKLEFDTIHDLGGEENASIMISRLCGEDIQTVDLPYSCQMICGRDRNNDIVISSPRVSNQHFRITCEAGNVHITDLESTNHIYINGQKATKALLKSGDILSIFTIRIKLDGGVLHFFNTGSGLTISDRIMEYNKLPERFPVDQGMLTTYGYPRSLEYHLSPRVREQLPKDPIILSAAPGAASGGNGFRGGLAYLIGSGAMIAASMATGAINPAMMIARGAGMISPIATMAMYGKMNKEEKKKLAEYEALRQETYTEYIKEQRARISKVGDIQRRVVGNENPAPEKCLDTVMDLRINLWERMYTDSDFLSTRLGIGSQKLCVPIKSHADNEGYSMGGDELEELAGQIIEENRLVENIPVCAPLAEYQTVGLVGSKEQIIYQMRSMIVELTSQHASQDLRLVGLFDASWRKWWGVIRWLPHIWDESGQVRYISFNDNTMNVVCELLADVISQRSRRTDEERKKEAAVPHYLLFVQSRSLIQNESIYEDLISNDPGLGITTVFIADSLYELPQTCQYIIDMTGRPVAYEREKYDERSYFVCDNEIHQGELERFARRMAAIELETLEASQQVPSSVTFLQGYGVRRVEDLNVEERWESSEPFKTLSAPIGVMEGGKLFNLDVRSGDTSHGPHGLLAGTTSSGKSELLQSWLLSMAVNYHPHDVNFVIIDYKGGGMADLMEPLPHVTGKITNIDRNIMRSLISLKSELKRRQRLFAECGVNNIDKYQKAWQEGKAKERLPHLILVTDEFAELKKEEPEFLAELNSVATVGRSLGIHMLLATQRPAGVVTDQINSNSRFRICMKVQDVLDSREMLKRSDAAKITNAGRAYIRVGEDEIFELFQSFYSGAEYLGNSHEKKQHENEVRIIAVTGERINPIKSKKARDSNAIDELTAIVEYINKVCDLRGVSKLPGPWLPELKAWITLAEIGVNTDNYLEEWSKKRNGIVIPVGMYDIPDLQKQGTQYLNITDQGHIGIFGIPSSGKTTLIKTIIMTLGVLYSPEEVEMIALDAGDWSLKEYEQMPQMREVILNQDEKAIAGFITMIRRELDSRRHAFVANAVSTIEAYRRVTGNKLPSIVIAVNHLEHFFESYMDLTDTFLEIASNGAMYGIHIVFTSNSTIGISYKFIQLIKGAVTMQLPDKGDYAPLVGQIGNVSLPNVSGRALMKGNPPIAFQTAVYVDEKDDKARHDSVVAKAAEMADAWKTMKSKSHGNLDQQEESLSESDEGNYDVNEVRVPTAVPSVGENSYSVTAGFDNLTLEPVKIELDKNNVIVVSGITDSLKTDAINDIVDGMDSGTVVLRPETEGSTAVLEKIIEELNNRKKVKSRMIKGGNFDPELLRQEFGMMAVVIDDLPGFASRLSDEETEAYLRIINKSSGLGTAIIAGGTADNLEPDGENALIAAAVNGGIILAAGGRPSDHRSFISNDDPALLGMEMNKDEAALLSDGTVTIIRLSF